MQSGNLRAVGHGVGRRAVRARGRQPAPAHAGRARRGRDGGLRRVAARPAPELGERLAHAPASGRQSPDPDRPSASSAPSGFAVLGAMGLLRTVLILGMLPLGALLRLPAARAHRVAVGADRVPARVRRGAAALQRAGRRPVGGARALRRRAAAGRDARPGQPGGAVRARRRRRGTGRAGHAVARSGCWRSASSPRWRPRSLPGGRRHRRAHGGRRCALGGRDRDEPARRAAAARRRRSARLASPCCCTSRGRLDFLLPGTHARRRSPAAPTAAAAVRPRRPAPVRDRAARAARRSGGASSSPPRCRCSSRRAERHTWAVRGWTLAIASFGLAWAAQRGDRRRPAPAGRRAPRPRRRRAGPRRRHGRGGLRGRPARATGSGGGRSRPGWPRRPSSSASSPCSAPSFDGRWSMPAGRPRPRPRLHRRRERRRGRSACCGSAIPAALPLDGWALDEGLAYATTDDGAPTLENLWVGSDDGRTGLLARRPRPGPHRPDRPPRPAPRADGRPLRRRARAAGAGPVRRRADPRAAGGSAPRSPASSTSSRSTCRRGSPCTATRPPSRCGPSCPSSVEVPTDGGRRRARSPLDLSGAAAVLPDEDGRLRWSGPLEATARCSCPPSSSDRWELEVDGETVDQIEPFGWATGFEVGRRRRRHPPLPHPARALRRAGAPGHRLAVAARVLVAAVRARSRPAPRVDRAAARIDRGRGRSSVRSSRLTALVILGGVVAGGLVLDAADEPADAPPPTPDAGRGRRRDAGRHAAGHPVAPPGTAPAAPPPTTGSPTTCVLIANPTDEAAHGRRSPCSPGDFAPPPVVADDDRRRLDHHHGAARRPPRPPSRRRAAGARRRSRCPPTSRIEVAAARARGGARCAARSSRSKAARSPSSTRSPTLEEGGGRATAPCSSTAAPRRGRSRGASPNAGARELLVFMNPFPDDATVTIDFATDEGTRADAALPELRRAAAAASSARSSTRT